MPSCYAVGAKRALLYAALRAHFCRGLLLGDGALSLLYRGLSLYHRKDGKEQKAPTDGPTKPGEEQKPPEPTKGGEGYETGKF